MQLLQDGVIAALAAVGLATIVWFTVTALTHPRERVRSETAVIVPARGAAETLEHTVRTLESERYASGGFSRIIIPHNNLKGFDTNKCKIQIVQVRKVEEAFRHLFG